MHLSFVLHITYIAISPFKYYTYTELKCKRRRRHVRRSEKVLRHHLPVSTVEGPDEDGFG